MQVNKAFVFGCLPFRALLAILAYHANEKQLRYASYPAFAIAIGFMTIFTFGLRKTGVETNGRPIWWNRYRPVHALLYSLFAYYAYRGNKDSWIFLAIDVLLGAILYLRFISSQ